MRLERHRKGFPFAATPGVNSYGSSARAPTMDAPIMPAPNKIAALWSKLTQTADEILYAPIASQFGESSLIATFRGLEEMMAYGYERFLLKLADQVEADNRR
jgi:hypothetical protein